MVRSMPSIAVGEQIVEVRQRGEGRPSLLLLHGAGCGSVHFAELLGLLAGQCRAVAIDLPGHGRSPAPEPFPLPAELLDHYADLALEAAVKLGLGRPIVVGHSMGGAVALRMALRHGEHLDGLVLMATAARLKVADAVFAAIRRAFDGLPQMMAAVGYSPATPPDRARALAAQQLQAPQEVVLADFMACHRFDERDALARITHRAAVISAADDRLTPPKLQAHLAEGLPRATLQTISRAGHFLYAERPDAVAEAILAARAWIQQDPGPRERIKPPKPTVREPAR